MFDQFSCLLQSSFVFSVSFVLVHSTIHIVWLGGRGTEQVLFQQQCQFRSHHHYHLVHITDIKFSWILPISTCSFRCDFVSGEVWRVAWTSQRWLLDSALCLHQQLDGHVILQFTAHSTADVNEEKLNDNSLHLSHYEMLIKLKGNNKQQK